MVREIQKFDVGLKAFVERNGQILVIRESIGGLWEVPGGRIDVGEERLPLQDILLREISEELGSSFTITIGHPFITWVRVWTAPKVGQVYLTGFRCTYVSGEITISDEHTEYQWVSPKTVSQLDFAPGYREALDEFWKTR